MDASLQGFKLTILPMSGMILPGHLKITERWARRLRRQAGVGDADEHTCNAPDILLEGRDGLEAERVTC
jgi:hypothetical protein